MCRMLSTKLALRRWVGLVAIGAATSAAALSAVPALAASIPAVEFGPKLSSQGPPTGSFANPPDAGSARASSFAGNCQMSGVVRFDPAMTNTPQQGRMYGQATGSCTGTLTGPNGQSQPVNGETVDATVQSQGLESCGGAKASGTGYLDFAGRHLYFTYDELRTGPAFTFKLDGAHSGSAALTGNVSSSASPAAIAQACGSTGLTEAPVDVRITTTPAISG